MAKALAELGIDTIFGLMGDANLFMLDSFVRDQQGRFISAAHEAGAVLMAIGYATTSGKLGVASVTHGPGLVNTMTPLVEGVRNTTPMLLLCGDVAVENINSFQKIAQRDLILSTGAGFEQLRSPKTFAEDVATACRRAELEQRPIALNIPADFQWQEVEYQVVERPVFSSAESLPSGEQLDNAIGIIAAARRPIVLAGRGAISAESRGKIIRFAERSGALLATTLKAKGLFTGEDFDLGICGTLSSPLAAELIMSSDCVISFGASLNRYTTAEGSLVKGKRVIQVNLEQSEIGKHMVPHAGLVGESGAVADLFVEWLDEAEIPSSGFRDEKLRDAIRSAPRTQDYPDLSTDQTVDLVQAMTTLNRIIPADRILATDAGRCVVQAWRIIDVQNAPSMVHTLNFGSIGLGLSEAIGAAIGDPKGRPVLLVTGDGGFMLGGLNEFNTAVRYGIDLIVVVGNDASYGMEHIQFCNRDMDPSLTVFEWPELAPVAEALGGYGITVRTIEDLENAAETIRDRKRPILIDLKLDPNSVPEIHRLK